MGVPKFFRWISERYPCLSVSVDNNQIPNFDCLYLDMNGIIHMCSHPDDSNVQFRITESDIFSNVFNYIEFLFKIVKPKDVFFLAVDGVAPRAKMNQQRARRFKSAKEAINREIAAIQSGIQLPDEKRFDSNAITPGTEFMNRLQTALKDFLSEKIKTDSLWQGVDVILSGHETPGEGEHKIQEFIRYRRSLPDYNPNTRHCLYGLDADLIILGLASHEPYFSLLREEVTFSKKKTKRAYIAEETKFFLLHLSLLREYIDYEFNSLKEILNDAYSLERIIDDWIIMSFLVGNDFIPHLPNLHIHTSALPFLWETYLKTRPKLDGYMNDSGKLNLDNLLRYINELSVFDREVFNENYEDMQWMLGKTGERLGKELQNLDKQKKSSNSNQFDLDVSLCNIFDDNITELLENNEFNLESPLHNILGDSVNEGTKCFISINEECLDSPEVNQDDSIFKPYLITSDIKEENSLVAQFESMKIDKDLIEFDFEENENILNESLEEAVERNDLPIILEAEGGDEEIWELQYRCYKRDYYFSKLGLTSTDEVLVEQANEYIKALQWISFYYFCGVPSWGWFYPQHYAPFISDLFYLSSNLRENGIEFDIGRPFLPFEQLMAVLPSQSCELLPSCFQSLMTLENSPIIDFYPKTFKTDLNGKKKEWEAVVLIPFIDEKRLVEAIETKTSLLTCSEALRNVHGPHIKYRFSNSNLIISEIDPEIFRIPRSSILFGLCQQVRLDVICQGFPSFKHIDHTFTLEKVGVKIFEFSANSSSIVLRITPPNEPSLSTEIIAKKYINQISFVNWPAFIEVKVVAVLDETHKFTIDNKTNEIIKQNLSEIDNAKMTEFKANTPRNLFKRSAITIDTANLIVLETLHSDGKSYTISSIHKAGSTVRLEHNWNSNQTFWYLQQLSVLKESIDVFESNSSKMCTKLNQLFPKNVTIFALDKKHYGRRGVVEGINNASTSIKLILDSVEEPNFPIIDVRNIENDYMNAGRVTELIQMNPLLFSRITGTLYINQSPFVSSPEFHKSKRSDRSKTQCSIGLDLKNNKSNLQIPGWVIKVKCENSVNKWLYSMKVIEVVMDYKEKFPEIFEFIKKPNFEKLSMEDVFDKEVLSQKLVKLQEYLNNLPFKNLERISNDCEIISESNITLIEHSMDNTTPIVTDESCHAELVFRDIYTPHHSLHGVEPDKSTIYELLDRVVCSTDGYTVPLGLRGIVIGIEHRNNKNLRLDVLFDKAFKSAISIRGSKPRCYRMPSHTLINITYGMRKFIKIPTKKLNKDTNSNYMLSKKNNCLTEFTPQTVNLLSHYEHPKSSPQLLLTMPKSPKSPQYFHSISNTHKPLVPPPNLPLPPNEFLVERNANQKNFIAHCNKLFINEIFPEITYDMNFYITDYEDVFKLCMQYGINDPKIIERQIDKDYYIRFTSSTISLPEVKNSDIFKARKNIINSVYNQFNELHSYYNFHNNSPCHYYTPEHFKNNPFLEVFPQPFNMNQKGRQQNFSLVNKTHFPQSPSSITKSPKNELKTNNKKRFIPAPKPRDDLFKQ